MLSATVHYRSLWLWVFPGCQAPCYTCLPSLGWAVSGPLHSGLQPFALLRPALAPTHSCLPRRPGVSQMPWPACCIRGDLCPEPFLLLSPGVPELHRNTDTQGTGHPWPRGAGSPHAGHTLQVTDVPCSWRSQVTACMYEHHVRYLVPAETRRASVPWDSS